jgi:DNA invertase Pin-like site-specific DNA recombinase
MLCRGVKLRAAATRMGHEVVQIYQDNGISGSKGRDKRPAFDQLHNDATRRKFDVVMAWSVDRLGRSLQDLVAFLEHLRSTKVELFLHQQGLDTATPAGRAMFGMLSVFSEFEAPLSRERVPPVWARAKRGTEAASRSRRPGLHRERRAAHVSIYGRRDWYARRSQRLTSASRPSAVACLVTETAAKEHDTRALQAYPETGTSSTPSFRAIGSRIFGGIERINHTNCDAPQAQ